MLLYDLVVLLKFIVLFRAATISRLTDKLTERKLITSYFDNQLIVFHQIKIEKLQNFSGSSFLNVSIFWFL